MAIENEKLHGQASCSKCGALYWLKSVPVRHADEQTLTCRKCQTVVFTSAKLESYWLELSLETLICSSHPK